jgi:hypothetical protein
MQYGKPSLVCDLEIYRYLIDDFVIQYCQKMSINLASNNDIRQSNDLIEKIRLIAVI